MSIRAALLPALLLLASPARALPPHVIDYGGFSRVMTGFDGENAWQIERYPGLIRVTLPEGAETENPAPLFSNRVDTIVPWWNGRVGGYDIRYACDCEAEALRSGSGMLIIDLRGLGKDGGKNRAGEEGGRPVISLPDMRQAVRPVRGGATVTMLPEPIMPGSGSGTRFETGDTGPARTAPLPTRGDPGRRASRAPLATPLPRPRPAPGSLAMTDADRVASLRDMVLERLREAAGAGTIAFDPGSPYTPKPPPAGTAAGAGTASSGAAHGGGEHTPPVVPGVRRAEACPDDAALDPTRWAQGPEYRDGLGALRGAVFDMMGQPSTEDIVALARHYLAYGMGLEARRVARGFDIDPAEALLLSDLGAIVEGLPASEAGPILGLTDCGRRHAVWRAAALAGRDPAAMVAAYEATDAALRDLPGPLRKMVGGQIALAAFDGGDEALALRVWRALENTGGLDTAPMRLLAAETAFEQGGTEGAVDRLLALAEQRGEAAPQAALRLVDRLVPPAHQAQAERLGVVIGDLALVMRGHPDGVALVLAGARLDARYGRIETALAALDREAARDAEAADSWNAIARRMIREALTETRATDAPGRLGALLTAAMRLEEDTGEAQRQSDAARAAFADTLTKAGVPNLAQEVLTVPLLTRSAAARRALARASLARNDPETAEAALAPLRDADADALRARAARMKTGAEAGGSNLFEAIAPPPRRAPIAGARALITGAEDDAKIIEDLINDG